MSTGKAKTLAIQRSVAVVNGEWVTKATKTHAGRVGPGRVRDRSTQATPAEHDSFATEIDKELGADDPVFTLHGELARPISPGHGEPLRAHGSRGAPGSTPIRHALRHFAATQMVGAGTDVRTAAGRLGHADASTTLRVYAHALPERDRAAAEMLGKALQAG